MNSVIAFDRATQSRLEEEHMSSIEPRVAGWGPALPVVCTIGVAFVTDPMVGRGPRMAQRNVVTTQTSSQTSSQSPRNEKARSRRASLSA